MIFPQPALALPALRSSAERAGRAESVRAGFHFPDGSARPGRHADLSLRTEARIAPGWLSMRLLLAFPVKCTTSLGTEILRVF
ncbi:MAG: hypothetical protein HC845_09385 [Akkermansiaceae bacterium]|nr:hypothetical protein [Akkermansiaceae bacterium]